MSGKLKVLDLFSGIGGFSLGLERTGGFETVAFCEIEPFPRKVLAKHWPSVPCFDDVRTLKGTDVGPVDVICGGYPCQPFSTAGQRRGEEDDRHLWPEFSRLVAELRPTWVIGENVAGHISMGLDDVLSDLEGQGYACRTFVIPACAVGAPHQRYRCWTLANANQGRRNRVHIREKTESNADAASMPRAPHVADAENSGPQRGNIASGRSESIRSRVQSEFAGNGYGHRRGTMADAPRIHAQGHGNGSGQEQPWGSCRWLPEPDVGRVAHGVPQRVDRLKALGNAVVPQIPEMIGRAILDAGVHQ